MKKATVLEMVNTYKYEYAINENPFVQITKGVSSGSHGNLYEYEIKLALNNFRFKGIALQGNIDTRKKVDNIINKIEIKQGCSELAIIDENGNIKSTIMKSDLIVYNPDFVSGDNAINGSYILNVNDFIKGLNEIGLIRYKKSTSMSKRPKELQYNDRIAIQSYKNSKKKYNALYDMLEQYGQELSEWLAEHDITPIEV